MIQRGLLKLALGGMPVDWAAAAVGFRLQILL